MCNDNNDCTIDTCVVASGCIYTNAGVGTACDDGDGATNNDKCDGSGNCAGTNAGGCDGWVWNGACWYTGGTGQSCITVCGAHCGFDSAGSTQSGNQVGVHFWPGKASGNNWVSIECSSTDNNTNWGADGGAPDGAFQHGSCHLNCACNC